MQRFNRIFEAVILFDREFEFAQYFILQSTVCCIKVYSGKFLRRTTLKYTESLEILVVPRELKKR